MYRMSKCCKAFLLSVLVISAIASVVYFFVKRRECCELEDIEFFDDDFELDEDLKPASSREYVSLGNAAETSKKEESSVGKAGDIAADLFAKASEKASDFADKASEKASDFADKASDTISVLADKANDKISDLMTKAPEQADAGEKSDEGEKSE